MALSNALVVVNAGSSSIKFSLYAEDGTDLSVFLKGQIEGLYTDGTHFTAREIGSGPSPMSAGTERPAPMTAPCGAFSTSCALISADIGWRRSGTASSMAVP